jgi:hypothetical protein
MLGYRWQRDVCVCVGGGGRNTHAQLLVVELSLSSSRSSGDSRARAAGVPSPSPSRPRPRLPIRSSLAYPGPQVGPSLASLAVLSGSEWRNDGTVPQPRP